MGSEPRAWTEVGPRNARDIIALKRLVERLASRSPLVGIIIVGAFADHTSPPDGLVQLSLGYRFFDEDEAPPGDCMTPDEIDFILDARIRASDSTARVYIDPSTQN